MRRTLAGFPRLEPLLDREGGALSGGEQAAPRDRPVPRLRARAHPPRRADGGHPALHRRCDRRPPPGPQPRAGRHHRDGGAEPRFHHRALRPGAAASEGGDLRRGQGGGCRQPRPHRGVHGLRRGRERGRGAPEPRPARRRKPCAALGFRARRACRRGAGRPSAVRRRPLPVEAARAAPGRRIEPAAPVEPIASIGLAAPRPQREDFLHDRPATHPRAARGDRPRARHEHVRRPRPGVPRRHAGHPRRLRRRGRDAGPSAPRPLSPDGGLSPFARGEPPQRLVREDRSAGRPARAAPRPDGRPEGQRVSRGGCR